MQRKINALKFELESDDGKIVELIAWIVADGDGKHLKPAHPDHCLLDVRAGGNSSNHCVSSMDSEHHSLNVAPFTDSISLSLKLASVASTSAV